MSNGRLNLIIFLLSPLVALNSCLNVDDPDPSVDAADGIYIKGGSTAFQDFDKNGLMNPALNEVNGQTRAGLFEIFVTVSSDSEGFNIVEVVSNIQTIYGPTSSEEIILTGEDSQISGTIEKGTFGKDAGEFTVREDGIYHIIIDKQTSTYVISPIWDLTLYDHPTGEEWSDMEIPLISGFDKSNMSFETTGLDMKEGEFRFRYGHGDKIEISGDEVKVHTSFGGLLSATGPGLELSMVPGANSYLLEKEYESKYKMVVNWTVGIGFTAQMSEADSTSYPEHLFMIGDGISSLEGEDAWNWDLNDFEMIPVYSNPHLFWRIVWLNSNGAIRFAPQKGPGNDFGREGDKTDNLFSIGQEDVPVPGTQGYHMIMVNFQTEQISISQPEVYLIGDAVGSWDTQNMDYRLTVDNSYKIITLLKEFSTGTLRMYAWHEGGWFTNWWNAEFNVFGGQIVYRGNRPHLDTYAIDAGKYTVTLQFITGAGVVESCACEK